MELSPKPSPAPAEMFFAGVRAAEGGRRRNGVSRRGTSGRRTHVGGAERGAADEGGGDLEAARRGGAGPAARGGRGEAGEQRPRVPPRLGPHLMEGGNQSSPLIDRRRQSIGALK